MGYRLEGYTIKGEKSLFTIPGMLHYIDARFGVTTVNDGINDRIVSIQELSPQQRIFSASRVHRRPALVGNAIHFNPNLNRSEHIMCTTNVQDYLPVWKTPSKYGFYQILNWGDGAGNLLHGLTLTDTTNGGNFVQFGVTSSSFDGTGLYDFNLNRRVNGTSYSPVLASTHDMNNRISINCYKVVNNSLKIFLDNVQVHELSNYSVSVPSVTPSVVGISHNNGNNTLRSWKLYVSLMYDWSGYADAEVEAFHTEIQEILGNLQQIFIQLES